jgi:tRNA1Val (adenine37-N6)-methyltransferase
MAFDFRGISVEHQQAAQKIGTDAVLLAGFFLKFAPKWGETASLGADLGAGSGVIGLLLAHRLPLTQVFLVEKEELAASECAQNARNTVGAERALAVQASIPDWTPPQQLDWAVSNPPYFTGGLTGNPRRDAARHRSHLPPRALSDWCKAHIRLGGSVAVVVPDASDYVAHFGFPSVWLAIGARPEEKPSRHLALWTDWGKTGAANKQQMASPERHESLYDDDGQPSEFYRDLCGPLMLRLPSIPAKRG